MSVNDWTRTQSNVLVLGLLQQVVTTNANVTYISSFSKSYNEVGNSNWDIINTIETFLPFEKLCNISPGNHPSTFCQNETKKKR